MIEIFTGHFGSGKTEIVLNRAVALAEAGIPVHVVDLDIVKPYFRSREARTLLTEVGVNLIMPNKGWEDADLPVISPGILGAFTSAEGEILVDVGGDPGGALALAAFAPVLQRRGYRMLLVINPYRPFTGELAQVQTMLREIEHSSRLHVDGLAGNPNLGEMTEWEDLLAGYERVQAMAEALDLPVLLKAVTKRWAGRWEREAGQTDPLLPIKNFLLPPWELEEGQVYSMDPRFHRQRRRELNE